MQGKIVKDAHNWQEMDGDTDLEKKLNSYLTCWFIIPQGIPSDECVREAKEIIKLIEEHTGIKL